MTQLALFDVGPKCRECHEKPIQARGLCNTCYASWWRSQNPERAATTQAAYRTENAEKMRQAAKTRRDVHRDDINTRRREKYAAGRPTGSRKPRRVPRPKAAVPQEVRDAESVESYMHRIREEFGI